MENDSYLCKLCNYTTDKKANYIKHCQTNKHITIKNQSILNNNNTNNTNNNNINNYNDNINEMKNHINVLEKALVEMIRVSNNKFNQLNNKLIEQSNIIKSLQDYIVSQSDKNEEFDIRIELLEDSNLETF